MKPFLHYLTMAVCLLLSATVYAQTNVSGAISTNTTWTASGSPYQVTGDISITAGNTLSIEEGVTVNFTGNYQILVRGAIQLKGSSLNPLKFNGHSGGSEFTKYMLLFRSTDLSNSPMDYVEFKGPQFAIQVSNETEQQQDPVKNTDTLSINYSKFTNSGFLAKGFDPTFSKAKTTLVLIKNSTISNTKFRGDQRSEPVEFINSTIDNSTFISINNHLGFYFNNSHIKGSFLRIGFLAAIEITNYSKVLNSRFIPEEVAADYNFLKLNKSYLLNSSIEMASCNVEIDQCVVSYTQEYSGNTSISFGSGKVSGSHIIGNKKNYGIQRIASGYNSRRPSKIENNSISSFNTAINIDNWTNGSGPDSVKVNGNNIFNQKEYYLINNSTSDIIASNNYWDSTNTSAIEQLIYDFNDNVSVGTVNYTPFLVSPSNEAPISPPTNVVKYKQGNDLIIQWSANPESDLAGYKLHWGNPTGYSYTNSLALGNVLTYTITNGDLSAEYAISAYDTDTTGVGDIFDGHQSWFSLTTQPKVSLTLSDSTILEGETKYLIATLDYPSPTPITVELSTQGSANGDFNWAANTITIAAGALSDSIAITHPQNTVTELTKELSISISNATVASIGADNSVKLYFTDDDPPTVTLSASNTSISEAGGTSTITATLSEPISKDAVINLSLAGSAFRSIDYTILPIERNLTQSLLNEPDFIFDIAVSKEKSVLFASIFGNIKSIELDKEITVIAGSNSYEEGSTDGSGTIARFRRPKGVALDTEGNLYIADAGNNKIRKISTSKNVSTIAGDGTIGSTNGVFNSASFNNPLFLTVDSNKNIYVSDAGNNKIRKISTSGIVSTLAGSGNQGNQNGIGTTASFNGLSGLIADKDGNIYVADSGNNKIRKITPGGEVSTFAGSGNQGNSDGVSLSGEFFNPVDITIDHAGNLYIADRGNSSIRKVSPQGEIKTLLLMPSYKILTGIDVDLEGDLYISYYLDPNAGYAGESKIDKIQMSTQVSIPAGQTTGTLTIKGIEDTLDEQDETIILTADNILNATLTGNNTISLTLKDNRITLTKVQNTPFPPVSSGAVAWGDFDRDGDQDVAIMGRSDIEGNITRIYRNNAGTFVNTNQNLERLRGGDIKWVDINKDGYIDLAVSGVNTNGERKTNLYINENGTAFVLAPEFNVVQVSSSKMAWGDLDNDGDIDLAIAGLDPNNTPIFYLYEKVDGQLTFNRITDFYGSGFTGGDIKIADFDLDGDNDIIYKGGLLRNSYSTTGLASFSSNLNGLSLEVTKLDSATNYLSVLANGDINGTPQFEASRSVLPVNGTMPQFKNGDIAAGDFNNDGRVDLLFTGEDNVGLSRTELYTQEIDGRFLKSSIPLSGLRESTATWVDYDVDGDLDLFMMGIEAGVQRTFLYKADVGIKVNRPPSPPTGLKFENLGNGFIRLSWDIPTDDHSTYLGYNIRLGTTPGGSELSNTQSNLQTGSRLITETAPIHTNSYLIQLSPGQYYWSVQAIDQGFQGSPFAPENTFALQYEWKTINQGGIIDRTITGRDKPIIGLLDIDDDQDLDMILGSSTDRVLYTFNGKAFVRKEGIIGYGGVENIAVGDINNDGRTDLVINSTNNQLLIFFNQGNGTLPVVYSGGGLVKSKIKIVDFDNDGKMDVLIAGLTSLLDNGQPKFHRYEFSPTPSNPSFFQFTDLSNQIVGLRDASYDFGDYDKDKDIDFIISGFDENSGLTTALYKNQTQPGSSLTLVRTTDNLVRVDNGTSDFVDYDGDGDLDILFTGRSPEGNVFEIYENRLSGNVSNWVNVSIGLDPIRNAKIDLGDFDGDGYNDLLYTGFKEGVGKQTRLTQFNPTTKKYVESTFDLGNIIDAEVEFGDIDADGDLDMIIAGTDATNIYNRTFKAYLNVRNESAKVTAQAFAENNGNDRPTKGGAGQTSNAVANYTSNQPPAIPIPKSIRTITTSGQKQLEFSWNATTDDHTPSAGLTYNLRIGKSTTGNEILPSNASSNGNRKIVARGNTEHNTSWVLNNLADGTYYWSVQALDASYIGSTFSAPQKFEIINGNLVTYQPPVVTDLVIRKSAPEPVGSVLGKVIATDPENDVLSYAITAGNAQGWFGINSGGEIIVLSAPATYPDSVKLTVTVSDGSNTVTGSVTVFICSVATVHQTLKSGNWTDTSVWSCGIVPTIIHAVKVNSPHTITLPASTTGLVKSLELGGQLQYNLNSNIQVGQE